jgi:hypothetical protein
MRWTFIDANGPRPAAGPSLVDQPARDVKGGLHACTGDAGLWVPLAPSLGQYDHVQVEVDVVAGDKTIDSSLSDVVPLG